MTKQQHRNYVLAILSFLFGLFFLCSEPAKAEVFENQNALQAARNYLSVMPFSRSKLIEQLEFDQFSRSAATYAADQCGADWQEQAKRAAQNYLSIMPFSRGQLVDQLVFDGFSRSQAEYGARAAGY